MRCNCRLSVSMSLLNIWADVSCHSDALFKASAALVVLCNSFIIVYCRYSVITCYTVGLISIDTLLD